MNNAIKLIQKQKEYYSENRDQIIEYHWKTEKREQNQDKFLRKKMKRLIFEF